MNSAKKKCGCMKNVYCYKHIKMVVNKLAIKKAKKELKENE